MRLYFHKHLSFKKKRKCSVTSDFLRYLLFWLLRFRRTSDEIKEKIEEEIQADELRDIKEEIEKDIEGNEEGKKIT